MIIWRIPFDQKKIKNEQMKNAINWFEIPVKNFNRAKAFYATLFGADIQEMPHPSFRYGMRPCDMQNGGVGGGIVHCQFTIRGRGADSYLSGTH